MYKVIRNKKYLRNIGISATLILISVFSFLLHPIVPQMEKADAATTGKGSTTEIAMTAETEAKLDLLINNLSGTFAASTEEEMAKFSVTTNNYSGYTLTISGSDDGDLVNSAASSSIESIEEPVSLTDFGNVNLTAYHNKWGYVPSKVNSSSNNDFLPSPTSTPTIIEQTSAPNTTANEYTIGLGARIDYSKPAGAYNKTLTLAAVSNAVDYEISYMDNTGDKTVEDLPEAQSGLADDSTTEVTLSDVTPYRDGYTFKNWCTEATTDNGTICSGDTYNVGDTFPLDLTAANVYTLYATWNKPTTLDEVSYFQDAFNCAATPIGTTKTLVDSRDNQSYTVKKLEDGNCWMIDNLNLGATTISTDLNITNTHLNGTLAASTFNSWKKTGGTSTLTNGEYINQSGTDSTSNSKYGTLYNYCALSAGTICGETNYYDAVYDLCPAGWRLPLGGGTRDEYAALYTKYNSWDLMRAPITSGGAGFSLPGFFNEGEPYNLDYDGYYWTSNHWDSTVISWNSTAMGIMYLKNDSTVNPGMGVYNSSGRSARCLFYASHSLTINFSGDGITAVEVRNGTGKNGNLVGVVSTSGGTITGLREDDTYYLNPIFADGYGVDKWETDSVTGGLSSEISANPAFILGTRDASVTLTSKSKTYIQKLSSNYCSNTPNVVYDNRDEQGYVVQRLADGNCWMIDSLSLGSDELVSDLTSANTNIDTSISAADFESWKRMTSNASQTQSYDNPIYMFKSGVDPVSKTRYGGLYNYCAISGNTICGETNSVSDTYNLCPAGWRLPTGGTSGDYTILGNNYDSFDTMRAPLSENGAAFSMPGYFRNGPFSLNVLGQYWTSTRWSDASMEAMRLNGSDSTITNRVGNYRNIGQSARCILDEKFSLSVDFSGSGISSVQVRTGVGASGGTLVGTISSSGDSIANLPRGNTYYLYPVFSSNDYGVDHWTTTSGELSSTVTDNPYFVVGIDNATITLVTKAKTYIQNLSADLCTNATSLVYDNRDGQSYAIQRLADGNCWMMDNLNLGSTSLATDLTSANTNLVDSISASDFNSWKRTSASSSTQSYTDPLFISRSGVDPTSRTKYGTLYNYCAMSAGTICSDNDNNSDVYNLCPAGWRLPGAGTNSEFVKIYDLYNSWDALHGSSADGGAGFALAGYFYSGLYNLNTSGRYWSSSWWSTNSIEALNMYATDKTITPKQGFYRYVGQSARCILEEKYSLTVNFADENITSVQIRTGQGADGGDLVGVANNSGEKISGLVRGKIYYLYPVFSSDDYGVNKWTNFGSYGVLSAEITGNPYFAVGGGDGEVTLSSKSKIYLQNLPASTCTATASVIYDNRDDQPYAVQRLDDGNCWMIDNLNLGAVQLTNDLTSDNTNLSTSISANTFNNWGANSGGSVYTTGEYKVVSGIDSVSGTIYGTLYNYCAVTAGTVCSDDYYNTSYAYYDLCPAGWRLPTSGDNSEFAALRQKYNSYAQLRGSILDGGAAFALSGHMQTSTSYSNPGLYGHYWSSSRYDLYRMYTMYLNNSAKTFGSSYIASRVNDYSARCMLSPTTETYSLTVDFAGTGVSSVEVRTGQGTSGNMLLGTISASGETVENLKPDMKYYLYPTFSDGYGVDSWASAGAYGELSSDSSGNPYFAMGEGDAVITLTGKTKTYIQDITVASCPSDASVVYDRRDEQAYTIKKLDDGNCWMLDNLALGAVDLKTDLTSANTHLETAVSAADFKAWRINIGSNTYTSPEFIPVSGVDPVSRTNYGAVYNYCAVSAGTICSDSNDSAASYDLCPSGWRLPTGSITGEYANLYSKYNSWDLMHGSAASGGTGLSLAGWFTSSVMASIGSVGQYWTSTYWTSTSMGSLLINSSSNLVNVDGGFARGTGVSARCIAGS